MHVGGYTSFISRRRRIVDRTVAAVAVDIVYAPPANTFLQPLQFHTPTTDRLTAFLPQNVQT